MGPERIKTHVEEAADCAAADNIGPIQVEENGPDGKHLAAVVFPNLQHLTQEQRSIYGCLFGEVCNLPFYPDVTLLEFKRLCPPRQGLMVLQSVQYTYLIAPGPWATQARDKPAFQSGTSAMSATK